MKILRSLLRLATARPPKVGRTPCDVVHVENKWRLLRYRGESPAEYARPILIVPSLINRHYVLDLLPGRSFVEWMVARGHDVFMIDWGTPQDEDRHLDLDTIAGRYLGRAIRIAARLGRADDVHLLGYCLGGTLTAMHTAAHGDKVASLTALATPVDFAQGGGKLRAWTNTRSFDVRELVSALGNAPWPLLQASFHMLKPTAALAKGMALLDRGGDGGWLEGFLAVERWASDNVSFPGAAYVDWLQRMYRDNALMRGQYRLQGRPADLSRITCPLHAIMFEDDHIVPAASAQALVDRVSSEDVVTLRLRGGHVGAVVARRAATTLWPAMSEFWASRDARPSPAERAPKADPLWLRWARRAV